MNVPVLMITYNRLEYTKKALEALLNSDAGQSICIIDNASTDGTREYLRQLFKHATVLFMPKNFGIAKAMNEFLNLTKKCEFVAKVDNDTLVPPNWCHILTNKLIEHKIDMIQAKHHIIPATHPDGWEGFTKNMKREKNDPSIYYNSFIGGSGIVFRRDKVNAIPETEWKLGGWRRFQLEHTELKKAFCDELEIKLLDEHGYGDYVDYYKETKRIT